jgi:hypothetical protein
MGERVLIQAQKTRWSGGLEFEVSC